jgi:hypothetical protein
MGKKGKKRYFVLGKKASVFFDPVTRLKVTSTDTSKPDETDAPLSKRVKMALEAGHIKSLDGPTDAPETDTSEDKDDTPKELTVEALKSVKAKDLAKAHSGEEFMTFYKENYEVSEEDEKAFEKMNKTAKAKFLQDAEEEGEDDE